MTCRWQRAKFHSSLHAFVFLYNNRKTFFWWKFYSFMLTLEALDEIKLPHFNRFDSHNTLIVASRTRRRRNILHDACRPDGRHFGPDGCACNTALNIDAWRHNSVDLLGLVHQQFKSLKEGHAQPTTTPNVLFVHNPVLFVHHSIQLHGSELHETNQPSTGNLSVSLKL